MTSAGNGAVEVRKLRIGSSKDIFDALRSEDFGVRLSIVKAIMANPEKVVSYGPYNGMELIDFLIFLLERNADSGYRPVLIAAVSTFNDPRVTNLIMNVMSEAEDTETVMACAARLSKERNDKVRDFMSRMLFREGDSAHSRMAADIMASYGDLGPTEAVRVAVLTAASFATPLLDDETEDAWLKELCGGAVERARALLEGLGETAFLRLRSKWQTLDDDSRKWLLRWGARKFPIHSVEMIADALKNGSDGIVIEALRAISGIRGVAHLFSPLISGFIDHADRGVRLAAIKAGAPLKGIRKMLTGERDTEIKIALMARLSEEEGAVDVLVGILGDSDWRIRAAAVRGLIRLGDPVIRDVEPMIESEDENVRIATAKVLAALGKKSPLQVRQS